MSACYFGAESCRHGHTADCPARHGNPWAEVTEEKPVHAPTRWTLDLAAPDPEPTWHREYLGNFSLGEE